MKNTNHKKKVIFITDPREWGGCEILLLDYLSAIDYSVTDVVLVTTQDFFSERISTRQIPVKVEVLPFKLEGSALQRFFRLHRFLKKYAGMDKIVFFTGAFYIFKWSEYLAGSLVSKGQVYSVENLGLLQPPPDNKVKYFGFIPALKLWWRKRLFLAKLRASFCKRILCVGQEVKNRMVEWYGLSSGNIYVAYNGIDTRKFTPDFAQREKLRREYGIPLTDIVIVSTARLSGEKCVHRLIEAAAKLQGQHKNIYTVIVGDGPLRAELEQLTKQLNVASVVKFVGYQERVVDFLRMSDVHVLPSDFEGFSLAMLEAMAVGLIPVRTNTCGAEEVIRNGVNGFIVECSTQGVYEGLQSLLALSPDQRRLMGVSARKTIEENFDSYKNIRQAVTYLELSPDWKAVKGK